MMFTITFEKCGSTAILRDELVDGEPQMSLMCSDGEFRHVTSIPEPFTARLISDVPEGYATFQG